MFKLPGFKPKKNQKAAKEKQIPFFLKEPKNLTVLPAFKSQSEIDVKYPLLEPSASARIRWMPSKKSLLYEIVEPEVDEKDKKLIEKLESDMSEVLEVKLSSLQGPKAFEYLEKKLKSVLDDNGIKLEGEHYKKILYYIFRDFEGLNEIEPMMHDPYIEDIGCSGMGTPIYITHRKYGSVETNITFNDLDYLSNFVVKIAERCGRYISYATPLLDGTLPDGSRVQASLAKDVTTKGPTFSIRKFRKNPLSPTDIIELKTADASIMAYLWLLIQYNASFLICGGVSTGKTTMLNALTMFIPPEDKIISIEDTREINLPHDNWRPSVARTGFGVPESTGKRYGEIDLFDLLKESFRQNPDYVIVGEVRGKEAYVMFQGIASGHSSMGTIHAGSLEDVIKRLATPPIEISPSLIESLDVVIVLTNFKEHGKSMRRVKEVVEIQSVDPQSSRVHAIKVFGWIPAIDQFKDNMVGSEVLKKISFQEGMSYPRLMEEIEDRKRFLVWLKKHEVFQFDEVCKLINLYYKDRNTVMEWVSKDLKPYSTKDKREVHKIWKESSQKRKRKPKYQDKSHARKQGKPH
jgi:flagellar protein FlaI